MSAALRACSLLVLAGGLLAEGDRVVASPGLALVLSVCLSGYLWFLAVARAVPAPSRRKQ